jgi:hypothetical protein
LLAAGSSFEGSSGNVIGVAYQPQTLVEVRWPWLCAIVGYAILATIFLVSIIIWTHSSGLQIVKGSSLAVMLGLDGSVRNTIRTGDNDLKSLKKKAKKTIVTLENNNNTSSSSSSQLGPRMQLVMT